LKFLCGRLYGNIAIFIVTDVIMLTLKSVLLLLRKWQRKMFSRRDFL